MKPAPIHCAVAVVLLVFSRGAAFGESTAVDNTVASRTANLFTTTNVNLRSGPGAKFEKRGVIPTSQIVTVRACIDGYSWCQVDWSGRRGWIYAKTLTRPGLGNLLVSYAQGVGIPVVDYEPEVEAAPAAARSPTQSAGGGTRARTGAGSFHVKGNDDLMGGEIGLPEGFGR